MSSPEDTPEMPNLAQLTLDADAGADTPAHEPRAEGVLKEYLWNNVPEFRRLVELRQRGWQSTQGDGHFRKQRRNADKQNGKSALFFYRLMQSVAKTLNHFTRAMNLSHISNPAVLDMCLAPGGFVAQILKKCPGARVRGMSLPVEDGGHQVLLQHDNVSIEFRDITTLAADMGIQADQVPPSFPEPSTLHLKPVFSSLEKYHLVICDGAILRTHPRHPWRERREATRLTVVQLALGLEHLHTGGTMIVLLHKLDNWRPFSLIHKFSKFSDVQLFKHPRAHNIRSSFYLVAKNIQADGELARKAVAEWKELYRAATIGTDEECEGLLWVGGEEAEAALEEFGERFVAMGKPIWRVQARALEQAPFMQALAEG
ncbi:hypothetical protein ACJ41O_008722 [Fusarium nematophilum]